jgi:CMP-N-acetylneuraminic acid synthetase
MWKNKNVLAFIPARGGSKRLPRKNVRVFSGFPLIYYSIALARSLSEVDWVVVSTDDPETAEIAEKYGATVIKRPPELAGDTSPTGAAAQHVIREINRLGCFPDLVLTLQPNCPLRTAAMVREALDLFIPGETSSVISVSENKRKEGEIRDGFFLPHYKPGSRSQDLQPCYFENGLVYVTDSQLILEHAEVFGTQIRPLVVDEFYSLGDIDTEVDFEVAEFLFNNHGSLFAF